MVTDSATEDCMQADGFLSGMVVAGRWLQADGCGSRYVEFIALCRLVLGYTASSSSNNPCAFPFSCWSCSVQQAQFPLAQHCPVPTWTHLQHGNLHLSHKVAPIRLCM